MISPFEWQRNKSIAPDDVPNDFSLALVYELPFGRGKKWLNGGNGFVNHVIGGWEITSTMKYSSGTPLFFRSGSCNVPGQFRVQCIPSITSGASPFLTPLGEFDPGKQQPLFNKASFQDPNLFNYYYGNGERVTNYRGFPFKNVDIGFGKMTKITERVSFLIRAEAFNAFNLHNFTCTGTGGCIAFNTDISSPDFGQWKGSVSSPRNIQLVGRIEF